VTQLRGDDVILGIGTLPRAPRLAGAEEAAENTA
jgi:hypothetical protein